MGALWSPSFSSTGGETSAGGQKGKVIIVPNSKEVSVSVINQGNTLGTDKFRVTRVPRPRLDYAMGGQSVGLNEERGGIPLTSARSISVSAIADDSFRNYSPEDANFRVSEIVVSLARGTRFVAGMTISGNSGSLDKLARQAQSGDRYVIEVKGVQRRNFRGDITDAGVTDTKNIPIK